MTSICKKAYVYEILFHKKILHSIQLGRDQCVMHKKSGKKNFKEKNAKWVFSKKKRIIYM